MSEQLLQLVTDIFFDVLKCVEKCRGNGRRSGAILDSGAQVLLAGVHQAAVRMIDDHEFLGTKQIVRNDQRTQSVVGDDPSGIADDVRVPSLRPRVRIERRVSMQVRTASLRSGRGVSFRNSCVRE